MITTSISFYEFRPLMGVIFSDLKSNDSCSESRSDRVVRSLSVSLCRQLGPLEPLTVKSMRVAL